MNLRMALFSASILSALSCRAAGTFTETNRSALIEADGRFAFYSGQGVGDLLAKGVAITDDHPTPFMRLRVPAQFVDAAAIERDRVLTLSFEVPDASIEATVHWFRRTTLETLYFHPGDPWTTGYAQVGTGADNVTVGLFEVIKWEGTTTKWQEVHTTGLLPDSNQPGLKYADDPFSQTLPENWK